MTRHVPVMRDEAIAHLNVRPGKHYVDATFGGGGYTRAILKQNEPEGSVFALDQNPSALRVHDRGAPEAGAEIPESPAAPGFGDALTSERLVLIHGNFADVAEHIRSRTDAPIAGVVFDLGLSTDLLEASGRGFSFERDEPLHMNYESGIRNQGKTARKVINEYSRDELERVLREYGGIRQAQNIAEGIAKARKEKRIETTTDLRAVVDQALTSATPKILAQVWQALRIEVNDELESLRQGLAGAWELIEPEGRVVVVAFHSLEDRIVKNFFRDKKKEGMATVVTRKPVRPSEEEVARNPRARSARLRALQKL